MEENQLKQQKCLTVVEYAEEPDDTSGNMEYAEFVLEKKQMLENFQELENQVGNRKLLIHVLVS